MNEILDEYTKQVWDFLDNMKLEEKYSISNLAKPENKEKFIQAIKLYMETYPWQGGVTFNHDYSKVYKLPFPDRQLMENKSNPAK